MYDRSSYIKDYLVWPNFIGMINRNEIASLVEIKNNPKKLLSLLKSLGADENLLLKPAHREELERYLKSAIDNITSALRHEEGLEIKRTESGMSLHYENSRFEEKSSLTFEKSDASKSSGEIYKIEVHQNLGTKSRTIQGKKDSIVELSETEDRCFPVTTTKKSIKRSLDDKGIVIKKTVRTASKCENDFEFKTERFKRTGIDIEVTGEDEDVISKEKTSSGSESSSKKMSRRLKWNGKPEDINSESSSGKEFVVNMLEIIEKYPETKSYYEEIVGKDAVDLAVKLNREHRR